MVVPGTVIHPNIFIYVGSSCVANTFIEDEVPERHFAYFYSTIKYGIILKGNSSKSTLQKKIIRLMAVVKSINSCKSLFKTSEILTVPCEYIFSLILFIVNDQEHFQINSAIHGVNTRNKNQLHRQIANISCFQKSAYHAGINIFNSLQSSLASLIHKKEQFKVALKRYLITRSFYCVGEFSNVHK
jgi:hypothetical protein